MKWVSPALFLGLCAVAVGVEAHAMFVDRSHTFTIAGREKYELEDFATGKTVAHAFLMRGEGLNAVRAQLVSGVPAIARVRWTISRGSIDFPPVRPSERGEMDVDVGRSPSWVTFPMARDGSSKDRWYTLELQLLQARATAADAPPRVTVIASRDNPDRGGVLWINGVRQPGSLLLKADRVGRTLYGRFQAEAEPHLPRLLRIGAVQWVVVLFLHWAFFTYAYALLARA